MKIIGGRFRGRKIIVPRGVTLIPTTDMVREAIFNIIRDRVDKAFCLDLFCGSGALGLEALSRGAKKVIFVDNSLVCLRAVETNLANIGFESRKSKKERHKKEGIIFIKEVMPEVSVRVELLKIDVFSALRVFCKKKRQVDIIFADPPYYKDKTGRQISQECLDKLAAGDIIKSSGIIVLEHWLKNDVAIPDRWALLQQKKYGDTALSFYSPLGDD